MDYSAMISERLAAYMDTEHNHGGFVRGRYKPAGVEHDWDLRRHSAFQLSRRAADIMSKLRMLYDEAGRASPLTFDTLMKPLLEAHRYMAQMGPLITLPRFMAESGELRQASTDSTKHMDKLSLETSFRKDIFDKLVEYRQVVSDNGETLDPEHLRVLGRLIDTGRLNGLHLDPSTQRKVKDIKKRLTDMSTQFLRNINEDKSMIYLYPTELIGMLPEFVKKLELNEDTMKYSVPLTYANYLQLTEQCRIADIRQRVEVAYTSRCADNPLLLQQIILLRQEEAEMLGYPDHNSMVQERAMAKNPENVDKFLKELIPSLQDLWKVEEKKMLDYKEYECRLYETPYNNKIDAWDFRYYTRKLEKQIYNFKSEEIREFFALYMVVRDMMKMFGQLMGLKFSRLFQAAKWSPDVQVFQVDQVDEVKDTCETLGYLYLDFYSREGKFKHNCCFPMQPGCLGKDGRKQVACCAILMNLCPLRENHPTFMDHSDVDSFFKEFGTSLNHICGRAKTALLFGKPLQLDFLHTTSQLIQNYAWEKAPLKIISAHYKTLKCLPDRVIDPLIHSRVAASGGFYLRQIVLALLDQYLHLHPSCDSAAAYARILHTTMGLEAVPGTNVCSTFTHMCAGYSARYYGHLWSDVHGADMYCSMFQRLGLDNTHVGQKYRRDVLEPSGSKDAIDMMVKFTAHQPLTKPFLDSKVPDVPHRNVRFAT